MSPQMQPPMQQVETPMRRPSGAMHAARLATLLAGACTGPHTHIDNPQEHRVFLDGRQTQAQSMPFRYYGTSRWDAQPKDYIASNGELRADWNLVPASQTFEQPEPVTPWLFPFDFPLELLSLLTSGQETFEAKVELPATREEDRPSADVRPIELDRLAERARQARILR